MRRGKTKTSNSSRASTPRPAARSSSKTFDFGSIWAILTQPRSVSSGKLKRRDLTFILTNLATLIQNGVSLPKALGTLAEEKALEKHRGLLSSLRRDLENGESFSAALSHHPTKFGTIIVNQVKVGERAGTMGDTLRQIAEEQEKSGKLRSEIVRKLSYPILLVTMGSGVITFLMLYVVPVFQETYADAGVPLPFVTQALISIAAAVRKYLWALVIGAVLLVIAVRQLRNNPRAAYKMDLALLRLPLFGSWLRDIAVLQLMDVLGNLMEAGFTLTEALGESANAIGNRAVKACARDLQLAILRGERFSREIERSGEMFPPIVSQLVIVGEQTGKLARATGHIRLHLEQEIERKTNMMVGTLEPVLTISLAFAVGMILLAIYLPMFDMISTVGS